jgi:type I restriction enzyme S subunit
MNRWPIRPLGEIVDLGSGSTPPKESQEFWEGETPWVSPKDMKAEELSDAEDHVSASAFEKTNLRLIPENTVLIVVRGMILAHTAPIRICRVPVAINQDMKALLPKQPIDPKFLRWSLQAQHAHLLTKVSTAGHGTKKLDSEILRSVMIPVPPLAEQDRIVRLLDEAEELRKLRTKADERTSKLVPALFNEMFGDPVANPFGWPLMHSGKLMEACDYGTSKKANEVDRGISVLRMGNVTIDGDLDVQDLKTVELEDGELAKQRLRAGDVLFNRTNSRELVGKTAMWDGRFDAVAASYFIRVRFRDDIEHPQHFTSFMNLPLMKERLAKMARGAVGQANINSKELQSIELPVPPIALQRAFADRVVEIRALEVEQSASCGRLHELFQSMLHRAFRGEL